jgi:hypothetical protein
MKSRYVNWSDEEVYRVWDFIGAGVIYNRERKKLSQCPHGNATQEYCHDCEIYPEDKRQDNFPAMNYAYPLFSEPDEEKIARVCEETSCTVVYNLQDDSYYLALTGGGMDLSQSIAMAYIICDGCIAWDMIGDIDISGAFSVSEEDYQIIMKEMERQLEISIDNHKAKLKKVREQLKK